jgi:hypothetical protein
LSIVGTRSHVHLVPLGVCGSAIDVMIRRLSSSSIDRENSFPAICGLTPASARYVIVFCAASAR